MAKTKAKAKATRATSTAASGLTNDVATAADTAAAARLDPSALSPVRKVTSVFVDLLASPDLQANLKKVAPALRAFKDFQGQDMASSLALANEGKKLTDIADRLENSIARVHQRVVRINQKLASFQTSLAKCADVATDDSEVATVLGPLALARTDARGTAKGVKTRKKNQRAKAKKTDPST